jgi:hypothetical protein
MLKVRFLTGLALLAIVALAMPSQAASADTDPIKEAVLKMYDISYAPVQSPIMSKIYSATFYDVTISLKRGDTVESGKLLVARDGDKVFLLEDRSSTQPMPSFLSAIRKDFRIKGNEDAALFESTLDLIFPVEDTVNEKNLKYKEMRLTGKTATFIRGAFFENRKGFVLTLGADGAITGVTYSLDIKP